MINITHKQNCSGCSACAQVCPKQCVMMRPDAEGFVYPYVNLSSCINCGLCERVCPVLSPYKSKVPKATLAAQNMDDVIRRESSSGGIFFMLAKNVLERDGIVFGVGYDSDWMPVHMSIDNIKDLHLLQTSKYVQSRVEDVYQKVREFLEGGKCVLFSGTPCQVSALNHFLNKGYELLYTVSVICHGVPSPQVWRDYIQDVNKCGKAISAINFRDKTYGWSRFSLSVKYTDGTTFVEPLDKNAFLQAFLKNLFLRPSCYACQAKSGSSNCDIELGDFWGVPQRVFSDDCGTSVVLVYTDKGQRLLNMGPFAVKPVKFTDVVKGNPCIERSVIRPPERALFWDNYFKYGIAGLYKTLVAVRPKVMLRIILWIKKIVKKILR